MPKKKVPQFPDSYVDELARDYDESIWMERNQIKTTEQCVRNLFDDKLGKEEVMDPNFRLVLDLGCGTGFSSQALLGCGFKVVGVDTLSDMLLLAKEKKKSLERKKSLELILADIKFLPLKPDCFDYIVSVSAYNFITHDANSESEKKKVTNRTARQLHSILKERGRISMEFYPSTDKDLDLFTSSFTSNGFEGFMVKKNETQKSGQTYLLLKKKRSIKEHL